MTKKYTLFLLMSFALSFSQQKRTNDQGAIHFSSEGFSREINTDSLNILSFGNAYNYHKPLSYTAMEPGDLVFRNRFGDKGSFFLVFESINKEEISVLRLSDSKEQIAVTNAKITRTGKKEVKIHSDKGVILSYLFTREGGRKRNRISLEGLLKSSEEELQLLEFLYVPELLSALDRSIYETYFSVKYGISLSDEGHYISSSKDTLWNKKDHRGFNNRVTGIGRDDSMDLYQVISRNSKEKALHIGFISSYMPENKDFLFWGDNNGETVFDKQKRTGAEVLKRIWKVQAFKGSGINDTLSARIFVEPGQLFGEWDKVKSEEKVLWLVKSRVPEWTLQSDFYSSKSGYEGVEAFNDIAFDSGNESYFTFMLAPEFTFLYDLETTECFSGKNRLSLRLLGGLSPYKIRVASADGIQEWQRESTSGFLELDEIPQGSYHIHLEDATGSTIQQPLFIPSSEPMEVDLAKKWYVSGNEPITIFPRITEMTGELIYHWYHEDRLVSEESVLLTGETGQYRLMVSDITGCEASFDFEVTSADSQTDRIKLYPNPVAAGESLSIDFHFARPQAVTISVFDAGGRQVSSVSLPELTQYTHSELFRVSGNYLLMITSGGETTAYHIIVK